jgi:hypothetical protein
MDAGDGSGNTQAEPFRRFGVMPAIDQEGFVVEPSRGRK